MRQAIDEGFGCAFRGGAALSLQTGILSIGDGFAVPNILSYQPSTTIFSLVIPSSCRCLLTVSIIGIGPHT